MYTTYTFNIISNLYDVILNSHDNMIKMYHSKIYILYYIYFYIVTQIDYTEMKIVFKYIKII